MDDAGESNEVVLRKSATKTSRRSDLKFLESNVSNSDNNSQISGERRNEVDIDDGSRAHMEQVCLRKQIATEQTGGGGASCFRKSRYSSIKRASLPPPPPKPTVEDTENTETLMESLASFRLRLGSSKRSNTSTGPNVNGSLPMRKSMRKSRLFPTARQSQIFQEKRQKLPPPPPIPE
ncbi:hypothetical protein SNE40_022054 [Patella caerulea]|uniref:Uncharacterized protein n=1 Tax=Patella caerulea TaxID=87958 RepID=A0AAN8GD58_PATCE